EFLPPGVFNVVCGDRDTGRELISHPTPSMVSITRSVRAGMEVARTAADDLKRVHLELGGKAPVVVFDDADIEATAEGIAGGGYFNAGQASPAATRGVAAAGRPRGAPGAGRTGHRRGPDRGASRAGQQHHDRRARRARRLLRAAEQPEP